MGPFRARESTGTSASVAVRVVGDRTFASRPVSAETADLSVRVARFFELDLATVWWSTAAPRLARIEGWHWDGTLRAELPVVAEAVADWTAQRLTAVAA